MSTYYETITFDENILGWVYCFSEYNRDFYDIHWHRDVELTYLFKGTCWAAVNGQTTLLTPGDLFIVNTGDTHYFSLNTEDGDLCDALVIILPYNLLKKVCPSIDSLRFQVSPDDIHYAEFILLFKKVLELLDFAKENNYAYLKINSMIYDILYLLLTHYCVPFNSAYALKTTSLRGINRCKDILEYIEENYKENITLESVSVHCNMSKEYIARTMRSNLGMTFKQYLTNLRLDNACLELLETTSSVLQISMNSGFPNCKSFITAFKRKYSLTPQLYRNSYQSART